MKKLIIALALTVILIAGIFGGMVLAAPPSDKVVDTPINPLVIVTGGDIDETPLGYSGYYGGPGWVGAPNTVHVSLTVATEGMVSGEYMAVQIMYVDEETGENDYTILKIIDYNDDCGDGTKTIEFDAASGELGGPDSNWQLMAYCQRSDETNFTFFYNYTMTFPKV